MPAVRYLVDDVDASLPTYQALGFELAKRWGPPFAILTRDGMELWLSGPGTSAAQILEDGSRPLPGNGWNRIVVIVSEMESMIEQARAAGATLRNGPISGPGGAQALIADPSGNVIELFQPKAE